MGMMLHRHKAEVSTDKVNKTVSVETKADETNPKKVVKPKKKK